MNVRVLETETWLPAPVEEVFAFFSDAHNLERLTPAFLRFQVLTPKPIAMAAGTLIDYRLRLRGIPMKWRTEITEWVPGVRFADKQLRGPYRQWIHTHTFEEKDGGTLMRDRVEYVVPGGILEPLIHPFVRRDVEGIFAYRTQVINEVFGGASATPATPLSPTAASRA